MPENLRYFSAIMTNKRKCQGSGTHFGLEVHSINYCSTRYAESGLSDLPVKAFSVKAEWQTGTLDSWKHPWIQALRDGYLSHCCEVVLHVSAQFADLWPIALCWLSGSGEVENLTAVQGRESHPASETSQQIQAKSRVHRAAGELALVPLSCSPVSEMYGAVLLPFTYGKPPLQSSRLFWPESFREKHVSSSLPQLPTTLPPYLKLKRQI